MSKTITVAGPDGVPQTITVGDIREKWGVDAYVAQPVEVRIRLMPNGAVEIPNESIAACQEWSKKHGKDVVIGLEHHDQPIRGGDFGTFTESKPAEELVRRYLKACPCSGDCVNCADAAKLLGLPRSTPVKWVKELAPLLPLAEKDGVKLVEEVVASQIPFAESILVPIGEELYEFTERGMRKLVADAGWKPTVPLVDAFFEKDDGPLPDYIVKDHAGSELDGLLPDGEFVDARDREMTSDELLAAGRREYEAKERGNGGVLQTDPARLGGQSGMAEVSR